MTNLKKQRIEWVDTAKAIGMFLVFYGHFISHLADDSEGIFLQFKYVYSFHMPFFFMISGFYFKPSFNYVERIRVLFLRRMLPVISFAFLLLPLWAIYYRVTTGAFSFSLISDQALSYLMGNPELDLVTWFLVCLFTAEVFALFLSKFYDTKLHVAIIGLISIAVGYYICKHSAWLESYTGIQKNTAYIHEGIVALGFYLIGYAVYPWLKTLGDKNKIRLYVSLFLFLALSIITYNLNKPLDHFHMGMGFSRHGDFLPFVVSSFVGTAMLILLGIVTPANKVLSFVGKNTLILLGLNGIFHHFINQYAASFLLQVDNVFLLTFLSLLFSVLSIAACYPIIVLFNKYVPQLFGKSFLNGPIFGNLEDTHPIEGLWSKLGKEENKLRTRFLSGRIFVSKNSTTSRP